jgi:hypothetical protein
MLRSTTVPAPTASELSSSKQKGAAGVVTRWETEFSSWRYAPNITRNLTWFEVNCCLMGLHYKSRKNTTAVGGARGRPAKKNMLLVVNLLLLRLSWLSMCTGTICQNFASRVTHSTDRLYYSLRFILFIVDLINCGTKSILLLPLVLFTRYVRSLR